MKAVGQVHYRQETDRFHPLYLHRGKLSLFPDDWPTKPVPVINVWFQFQPVAEFCPGMAYEQMEVSPNDPDLTIEIDLDVTPALIEYLYKQGETKTDILYEMAKAVGGTIEDE